MASLLDNFIVFYFMEKVIAKIRDFSDFVVCENASPADTLPVSFPRSLKINEIRAILIEASAKISEDFKGKKLILRFQREEQLRARYVRVGRLPDSTLHVFLFLREPDAPILKDRYELVPVSLLSFFHKTFKLAYFTASVEEREEAAFDLRPTYTMEGFCFPVVDARVWLRRYEKAQGIPTKRPAETLPDQRKGRALKKLKGVDGSDRPSLFTSTSVEEYARRKRLAVEAGIRFLAQPKTRSLLDLANEPDADASFEVVPGTLVGVGARPLSAEDFSAFTQTPQANYFISMAAGLDPERTKAMAKSKVRWKQGTSVWCPSTMMSIMARSTPRMRNFDAVIRSVLQNSGIAAGLNISYELPSEINPQQESDDDDDGIMSEDLIDEDGAISNEGLLLKHSKTLEELQDAILQLALEPYSTMLFSKT